MIAEAENPIPETQNLPFNDFLEMAFANREGILHFANNFPKVPPQGLHYPFDKYFQIIIDWPSEMSFSCLHQQTLFLNTDIEGIKRAFISKKLQTHYKCEGKIEVNVYLLPHLIYIAPSVSVFKRLVEKMITKFKIKETIEYLFLCGNYS